MIGVDAPWLPGDDAEHLVGWRIVGRGFLDLDGGGASHCLVIEREIEREVRVDVERRAVYWQRTPDGVGYFVTVPMR